jgi:NADH dehydrogenase FAD-containing subunit
MQGLMAGTHEHLLLVGGGHAHVAVLADWIAQGLPCRRATLLTPARTLRYSGTVPGWIAGQYARDDGTVDLAALAARAKVQLVLGSCTAIDPAARRVKLAGGQALEFDIVSIDTGGVGQAEALLGSDPRLVDIRPIDRFVERMDALGPAARIAVLGGGAGGAELAFALRNRAGAQRAEVVFVTGALGLLPEMSSAVRRTAARALERQGIAVIAQDAGFENGALLAGGRSLEPLDLIVAALGSGAPDWPRVGGLACDPSGFIAVDAHQRSLSHAHVFAVGDVAARQDRMVPHSGVHAVFAGPVLAANLRAVMAGREPARSYRPRWNNLYLMNTGDGGAIASYGPMAASGRWVLRLKHAIDMRWLRRYSRLAARTA